MAPRHTSCSARPTTLCIRPSGLGAIASSSTARPERRPSPEGGRSGIPGKERSSGWRSVFPRWGLGLSGDGPSRAGADLRLVCKERQNREEKEESPAGDFLKGG